MKLEDQVCSLELAKRLKELGVEQESLHWWKLVDKEYYLGDWKHSGLKDIISAFTVAELLNLLPRTIHRKTDNIEGRGMILPYDFHLILREGEQINIGYIGRQGIKSIYTESMNESVVNMIAKLLIKLIENHLIKEDGKG